MEIIRIMENSGFPYLSANVYLIRLEGKNILVDSGNYFLKGKLLAGLEENGLEPGEINMVINTHLHFDHFGNNDLFHRAVFYMPLLEIKYLLPVLPMNTADAVNYFRLYYPHIPPDKLKNFTRMILAQKFQLEWIQAHRENIIPVSRDMQLNEQMRLVHTFGGHSPGHICPVLQREEKSIGFTGDIFFSPRPEEVESNMMIFMSLSDALQIQDFMAGHLDIMYPGHGSVESRESLRKKMIQDTV